MSGYAIAAIMLLSTAGILLAGGILWNIFQDHD